MTDSEENVGSGTVSNVFLINRSDDAVTVSTPAENVRNGVTREVVLEIADELGFEKKVAGITQAELKSAEAVFLTNTTWGVREVKEVDGDPVDSHESVERIASAYFDRVLENEKLQR